MLIDRYKGNSWDSKLGSCVSEFEGYTRREEREHRASVLRKEGKKVTIADHNWNQNGRRNRYYVYWKYVEKDKEL